MIYRIFFQPDGACWCIQFKSFFRWVTVKAPVKHDLEPVVTHQVVKFDTLAEAEKYCVDRGIDRAYHRSQRTTYVPAVRAVAIPCAAGSMEAIATGDLIRSLPSGRPW